MKKAIGVLIVMLVLISGISFAAADFDPHKNSQFDNEKVSTDINGPLTLRVEAKQVGYRIWLLKAYGKNTWEEKIRVKSNLPCCIIVRYIVPGLEDFEAVVYYPYRGIVSQLIPIYRFFKPGEEKLIEISMFFGVSNYIIPALADNITKYIESFPILPEGDYRFEAALNPYFIDSSPLQYTDFIEDSTVFHLAAPK